jgi:hypothetical protein
MDGWMHGYTDQLKDEQTDRIEERLREREET